jgi:hypothetical protein
MTDIHSCSYYCDRPNCIKAQRDELRDKVLNRVWVGLTNAEIDLALKSCNTLDTYKYFRAIEAKLKEKNT